FSPKSELVKIRSFSPLLSSFSSLPALLFSTAECRFRLQLFSSRLPNADSEWSCSECGRVLTFENFSIE
ncbi:hypothetical protein LINPERPRIM_LOCUS1806, partial [Linum perenne]